MGSCNSSSHAGIKSAVELGREVSYPATIAKGDSRALDSENSSFTNTPISVRRIKERRSSNAIIKRSGSKRSKLEVLGGESGSLAHEKVLLNKNRALRGLDPGTQRAALRLFHDLKKKPVEAVVHGNKFVGEADYDALRTMDLNGLKEMLPDLEEETLKFVFRFFDASLDGKIHTLEFLMAVAMLCRPCDSPQEQLEVMFHMFDSDESGCLSRDEFAAMIRASVAIDLSTLLLTDEGLRHMEEQLEKEHAQETIRFWRAAADFRALPDDERTTAAEYICQQYVREGSPEEVNLPALQRKRITQALAAVTASGEPPSPELFAAAEKEMFSLMERNAFSRLREDEAMLEKLARAFFDSADEDGDGRVRFKEYRKWATGKPTVLAFFGQLRQTIVKLVSSTMAEGHEPKDDDANVEIA